MKRRCSSIDAARGRGSRINANGEDRTKVQIFALILQFLALAYGAACGTLAAVGSHGELSSDQ